MTEERGPSAWRLDGTKPISPIFITDAETAEHWRKWEYITVTPLWTAEEIARMAREAGFSAEFVEWLEALS